MASKSSRVVFQDTEEMSDREIKKASFLAEFDAEVEAYCNEMKLSMQSSNSKLMGKFSTELMRIPKDIREMTVGEFQMKYCSELIGHDQVKPEAQIVGSVLEECATAFKKPRRALGTVNEDEPSTVVKASKSKVVEPTPARATRSNTDTMKMMTDVFVTPALRNRAPRVQQTPLVPASSFKTPMIRQPRKGEKFTFVSIPLSSNGSPLDFEAVLQSTSKFTKKPTSSLVNVPLQNGQLEIPMESFQVFDGGDRKPVLGRKAFA